MVRDCPSLRGLVADARSRSTGNTILEKEFPGGSVALVGSISPDNFARRSIRYLFCDEVDRYKDSAEGDPLYLARQRTANFPSSRKIVLASSPTVAGKSRIASAYEESDQRKPWVPCPHCGKFQILSFREQVRWDKSAGSIPKQAAGAYYECAHCGKPWNDVERWVACEKAEWRAGKPFDGIAGFWISHLYSPWHKLSGLVKDFLRTEKNPAKLMSFVNTDLAELWEEKGEAPDWQRLYDRREDYCRGSIPVGAVFLMAGADVQKDRIEVEIVAWGKGRDGAGEKRVG